MNTRLPTSRQFCDGFRGRLDRPRQWQPISIAQQHPAEVPRPMPNAITSYRSSRVAVAEQRHRHGTFFDLPRELRDMVYEELFRTSVQETTDSLLMPWCGRRFCHPAILRTCRQIHGEATEYLHENFGQLYLVASFGINTSLPEPAYGVRILLNGVEADVDKFQTSNGMALPKLLRAVRSLVLGVNLENQLINYERYQNGYTLEMERQNEFKNVLERMRDLNAFLHNLYRLFLGRNLHNLEVTIHRPDYTDGQIYNELLSPAFGLAASVPNVSLFEDDGHHWTLEPCTSLPDIYHAFRNLAWNSRCTTSSTDW
jgi:hypothetical protein